MFKLLKILCGGCLADLIETGVDAVLSRLFFSMEVLVDDGLYHHPAGWKVVFDLSVKNILNMQALSGDGLEQDWMRYTLNKPFRFRFRFEKIERKYLVK